MHEHWSLGECTPLVCHREPKTVALLFRSTPAPLPWDPLPGEAVTLCPAMGCSCLWWLPWEDFLAIALAVFVVWLLLGVHCLLWLGIKCNSSKGSLPGLHAERSKLWLILCRRCICTRLLILASQCNFYNLLPCKNHYFKETPHLLSSIHTLPDWKGAELDPGRAFSVWGQRCSQTFLEKKT